MKAQTISDLEKALALSEASEQALIDLQIDRALLRLLLINTKSRCNGEKLISPHYTAGATGELLDLPPLQGYSDQATTPSTPGSGPNFGGQAGHNTLSEELARDIRFFTQRLRQ